MGYEGCWHFVGKVIVISCYVASRLIILMCCWKMIMMEIDGDLWAFVGAQLLANVTSFGIY